MTGNRLPPQKCLFFQEDTEHMTYSRGVHFSYYNSQFVNSNQASTDNGLFLSKPINFVAPYFHNSFIGAHQVIDVEIVEGVDPITC